MFPERGKNAMLLYNIAAGEKEELAVGSVKEGTCCILSHNGLPFDDMNQLIDRSCPELQQKLNDVRLHGTVVPLQSVRICAPIPHPRQDVICLGVNYMSHMSDMTQVLNFTKKQDTIYFAKRVNRANDPGGRIPLYDFVDSLDYEVELGVILGRDAFCVSREEALSYVLGYTIINDVSARNVQRRHQQWYRGKSLDGYTPMGPCIVTADEIGDVHDLDISCFVNDEKRQSSNTAYMITTVEEAIAELSQGMTLKAGTIIATGTPGGVAMGMDPPKFLKKGDVVRCGIGGIGELVNVVG